MFESVREKLARLRELDPGLWVFGAELHRHRLVPAAAEADIARVEDHIDIGLPEEYRAFLTEVANGGAGPGYGLDRLVRLDRPVDRSRLKKVGMRLVVDKPGMKFHEPRYVDERDLEVDPFDFALYGLANQLLHKEFVEELRQPFPPRAGL